MKLTEDEVLVLFGGVFTLLYIVWYVWRLVLRRHRRKKAHQYSILVEDPDGSRFRLNMDLLSHDQVKEILHIVEDQKGVAPRQPGKQRGFIAEDILTIWVPAILGLAFSIAVIWMTIRGLDVPPLVGNAMTTIVGYFFGRTAAAPKPQIVNLSGR